MFVSILFTLVPAGAASLDDSEITQVHPAEALEYRGIDAEDLDWLCSGSADRAIAKLPATLPKNASCTLLRDPGRGLVSAERTTPLVEQLRSELKPSRDYPWAEQAALDELISLGLDSRQVYSVTARYLNVRTAGEDAVYSTGIAVFVKRGIEGVPVLGSDATVIFDLDHTLRAVHSTWPTILVNGSTWALPKQGDCSVAGSSTWSTRAVEPEALAPVTLSTALLPDAVQGTVRLSVLSETMVAGIDKGLVRQIRVCDGETE